MSLEDQHTDCKSLRKVTGRTVDWDELARDCVCFANGQGGRLLIGIEDGEVLPPVSQRVPPELLERLRKRINELTVNVQVLPQLMMAENGGQFVELGISRALGVASTTDGRYFLRVSDVCRPVVGDEVLRLANERAAYPWESMTTLQVLRQQIDSAKLRSFCDGIRASDRVKDSVKHKTDEELLIITCWSAGIS
jgi:ATP-dependent DNA helicase RecG